MNIEIPNEAIEAGALAWDKNMGDRYGDEAVEELREEVLVILGAASAAIVAKALDDAADDWENLPANKGASISSGTWDWFELFPIQHIRHRAEDIRSIT